MGELNVSIHKSAMRRAATPGPLLARVIRPWRSDKKCASFAERFVEGVRTSDASRRDVSHAGISFAHLNFAMSVASRGLAFIAPGAPAKRRRNASMQAGQSVEIKLCSCGGLTSASIQGDEAGIA